ncbi:MAG: hypothetical protein DI616_15785 [Paracoccus denitrificans]|uniref:DNA-directed RNA polymerase C-terminal domain-containing protein n=1 Tax=Paracoccus denitrificans TaxID=266 RepID=A0A533I3T7_PARDE|nr:MAG: hypothetical protein DI616_15785 [Paracoccus denitrificans]
MAQRKYSAFEWICVDIANQAGRGLDKKLFEVRIKWVLDNFNRLTVLATPQKERPLYVKAVMALFEACRQIKSGHMVGLDATCSGMSIMSVLTKCYKGCWATNLIDPDVRNDAYTLVTDAASAHLGGGMEIERSDAKTATMTGLYGSQAEPRKIFGEDTAELAAFYQGLSDTAPGAVELLGDLKAAWQAYALAHTWILPDEYCAHVKVMVKMEARIVLEELDDTSFTHYYHINEGTERDLKLVANVTHSFDAYLLRSLVRRCNYDPAVIRKARQVLLDEHGARCRGEAMEQNLAGAVTLAHRLIARWGRCEVPDARLLDYVTADDAQYMDFRHIEQMIRICEEMLSWPSFHVVTVH